MNLEERIKAGMLFYESGHVDPVNQEIEERLKNERKDCKELMFDYNHCRPGDQDRQRGGGGGKGGRGGGGGGGGGRQGPPTGKAHAKNVWMAAMLPFCRVFPLAIIP